jgi:hypothetical protein
MPSSVALFVLQRATRGCNSAQCACLNLHFPGGALAERASLAGRAHCGARRRLRRTARGSRTALALLLSRPIVASCALSFLALFDALDGLGRVDRSDPA